MAVAHLFQGCEATVFEYRLEHGEESAMRPRELAGKPAASIAGKAWRGQQMS